MNHNARIVASAQRVIRGELASPDASGLCLALVRIVVEDALFGGAWRFYEWRTRPVERKPFAPASAFDPVARDMERSLRHMSVIRPAHGRHLTPLELEGVLPGDILFRWDAAAWHWGAEPSFYGHVGVMLPGGVVLENIHPSFRSRSYQLGVNSLTPVLSFPCTSVVRFDPRVAPLPRL